ncbi:MAG: hypothetical protein HGA45_19725 [Chloroflexales bacterium]|nr:hypothetical protein [Chloroflexales bacterium]
MPAIRTLASATLLLCALLGSAIAAPAPAAEPGPAVRLVDLDPRTINDGSFLWIGPQVSAAGRIFFIARTRDLGAELYLSDGTLNSAQLAADLCPGPCSGFTIPTITVAGTRVFFVGSDGLDSEIWSFDAATLPISPSKLDLSPGPDSSQVSAMVAFGGRLAAAVTTNGDTELVITDGTAGGTVRYDLNPGASSSYPGGLTVAGSRLFFIATNGAAGRELWTTTGGAPTMLELNPTGDAFTSGSIVAAGSRVFFLATDGVGGFEPGTSDGLTARLFDLNPGGDSVSEGGSLVATSSRAFFIATNGSSGYELGTSDGASASLLEVAPGANGGFNGPYDTLAATSGRVFFFSGPAAGSRLGTSDGATVALFAISPGSYLITTPSRAFFTAAETANSYDLWTSDGGAPTRLTNGFNLDLYMMPLVVSGERVIFTPGNAPDGRDLGTSDGQSVTLYDFIPDSPAVPYKDSLGDGRFLIWADDGARGTEPFLLDSAVIALGDIEPAHGASGVINDMVAGGGRVFFTTCTAELGCEPWLTDGTPEGTHPLDLSPDPHGSYPSRPTLVGSTLFFTAFYDAGGSTLWSINMAAPEPRATQVRIRDSGDPSVQSLIGAGRKLFFTARDQADDNELWVLDTTLANPAPQKIDLNSAGSSNPYGLTPSGDGVYFSADRGQGYLPGFSDGSRATIFTLEPTGSTVAGYLTAIGGRAYFIAKSDTLGYELGVIDGATATVIELNPSGDAFTTDYRGQLNNPYFAQVGAKACFLAYTGPERYVPVCAEGARLSTFDLPAGGVARSWPPPIVAGDRYYFSFHASATGEELGVTDGTSAQILDLVSGPAGSSPQLLGRVGGRAFFSTTTPDRGTEPAISDGTLAGSTLFDLEPGSAGSHPEPSYAASERGLLTAATSATGREPAVLIGDSITVLDVNPGPAGSSPTLLAPVYGRADALFWATRAGHGQELWASGGAPASTRMVQEIGPGASSGLDPQTINPYLVAQTGAGPSARLVFIADDGTGNNPWAIGVGAFAGEWRWLPIAHR